MQPRLFQLGNDHLLLNGDSANPEHLTLLHSAAKELNLDKAYLCFTDPPYNVNCGDAAKRRAKLNDRWFIPKGIANDNMTPAEYEDFLQAALSASKTLFKWDLLLSFAANASLLNLYRVLEKLDLPLKSLLIWLHRNVLSYQDFSQAADLVVYAGHHPQSRRNPNRGQPNVFCAANHDRISKYRQLWHQHINRKPVELLRDLLDSTTRVGDVIADPFAGTGSGLIAAHRTGRKWVGTELKHVYCIAALMRFRYDTAYEIPVYEIIGGQRVELSDADLEAEAERYKAQQGA